MCDHCGCRAFPPIAVLTAEHEEILSLAWQLAETTNRAPTATCDAGDAGSLRRRLLALLDPHVDREELALYPLLREQGRLSFEREDALEEEHRELRQSIAGGVFDRRAYYALAAHIEEEEMELFPAAMLTFDDDEWDELAGAGTV